MKRTTMAEALNHFHFLINKDGSVDKTLLVLELMDFIDLIKNAQEVYNEISDLSYVSYSAKIAISAYNEKRQDEIQQAIMDFIDDNIEDEELKKELKAANG